MKVNAIIQARCGSSRFPNKVFVDIDGHSLLWHVVDRLKHSTMINDIIIATTVNPKDDEIESWCQRESISCYRGSESDVLNRYYEASLAYPSDIVVRITADDPFKEPKVIDRVISNLIDNKLDLSTNNFPPSFPEGLDCEAFTIETLEIMEKNARDRFEREHVTQYVYHNPDRFKIGNVSSIIPLETYRWTIDTIEDYEMVKSVYAHRNTGSEDILLMDEILSILNDNPQIVQINSNVKRSAMYQ